MKSSIYILGINQSHNATAALLKDGKIIAAASEERFTRIKNQWGFPKKAIKFCLKDANIKPRQLNAVYVGYNNPTVILQNKESGKGLISDILTKQIYLLYGLIEKIIQKYAWFNSVYKISYFLIAKLIIRTRLRTEQINYISSKLEVNSGKIHTMDHHKAHGYAAYYSSPLSKSSPEKECLVITMDSAGDDVCSRIFVVKNSNWKEISSTSNDASLGALFSEVTGYLGMKSIEDEYKVMGLAPYCHPGSAEKVADIFRQLIRVEGLTVKSALPTLSFRSFIEKHLKHVRFDFIAGGIQKICEEILLDITLNAVKKTGTANIVFGGGCFMNIKSNMLINENNIIEKNFFMPSAGDESTAIGAAFFGYQRYCQQNNIKFTTQPLRDLYLGPEFSKQEIQLAISYFKKKRPGIKFKKMKNPAKNIAKLLADNFIVARFCKRMEFGARALGNRSILANPTSPKTIKIINEQIKGRDFWMPFAPVILKERSGDYLISNKEVNSPFMMLGFQTTERAQTELLAALHPYDMTARPQVLEQNQNPGFYEIIKEFEKLTMIGGLLNTSFNLHGEPIVCTPQDALNTFLNSGLKYLQIEDYLLEK